MGPPLCKEGWPTVQWIRKKKKCSLHLPTVTEKKKITPSGVEANSAGASGLASWDELGRVSLWNPAVEIQLHRAETEIVAGARGVRVWPWDMEESKTKGRGTEPEAEKGQSSTVRELPGTLGRKQGEEGGWANQNNNRILHRREEV